MKRLVLIMALPFMFLISSMSGCEKEEEDEPIPSDPLLNVEYTNHVDSEFAINVMQIRTRGKAGPGESHTPGAWTGNILPAGLVLAPGDMHIMDLAIPNLHWVEYRLGVIDANGNSIMLHEQGGWVDKEDSPSITHWGGHERSVYTIVGFDEPQNMIIIQHWSDWMRTK